MFKSYESMHDCFIIRDTNFIETSSINIVGIGWANFSILVADIYSKKNLPVAKNIALMLRKYPLASGQEAYIKQDLVQVFKAHNKYKYLLPCLIREINA